MKQSTLFNMARFFLSPLLSSCFALFAVTEYFYLTFEIATKLDIISKDLSSFYIPIYFFIGTCGVQLLILYLFRKINISPQRYPVTLPSAFLAILITTTLLTTYIENLKLKYSFKEISKTEEEFLNKNTQLIHAPFLVIGSGNGSKIYYKNDPECEREIAQILDNLRKTPQ